MKEQGKAVYKQAGASVRERVQDLISRMTLEEKLGQMMQLAAIEENSEAYIERYKLGSYLHALGEDITTLRKLNAENSRLGIPLIFGIDAIHGHCFEDGSTVFPVQLAMASTWNTALVEQVGQITASEAYNAGLDWTFSPVLCIARDPRWGRVSETFGEDSYLIGELGSALMRGYQGCGAPFAACAKHFAAYGETDGGRDAVDAHVSERQMRSVFLPPFEKMAEQGCKTMMVAYQSLNGLACSVNPWLMNTVLRDEWQYTGVAVTDWNNCGQLVNLQQAAQSIKEAVELCLQASNDMFMSTHDFFDCARELVQEGRIPESRIDESVARVLQLKFELGLFDEPVAYSREHQYAGDAWQVSKEVSRQSITLVKNTGVLPLNKAALRKLVLVGDNADNLLHQLGDWSFVPGLTAYQDSHTHRAVTVTLLQALRGFADNEAFELEFLGAEVCGPLCDKGVDENRLHEACENADLLIYCAGDALKQNGEFHDRSDLELPGNQNAVFDALCKTGKPLVSVLLMSKPHTVNRVLDKSDAVLVAFNPGAKGGEAIRECLFGEFNPCGKLPISFPRHVGQLPVYYNQAPGWHAPLSPHYDNSASYIDSPKTPLLAFGEGMSYSEIQYGEPSLSRAEIGRGESADITLTVSNNSQLDAVEVVQLYARWWISGVTSPEKNLIDFQRVELAPGESKLVRFTVVNGALQVLDKQLSRLAYQGKLQLMAGKSSKDDDLATLSLVLK